MSHLQIITDTTTTGYKSIFLEYLSIISILCGILVIVSKNPIVSVLFLIALFISIAAYLLILGANFIGISYLLVYVGAVSILFLFILMLINVRISELTSETSSSIPLALLIILVFNVTARNALPFSSVNITSYMVNGNNILYIFSSQANNKYIDSLQEMATFLNDGVTASYVSSVVWDSNLSENSDITSLGNIMYTSHSIWLIITSIILLLAMIGAIVITIKNKQ